MALNAFLKLSSEHQGDIHGSVTQKGRENTIKVMGVDHLIATPVLSTGAPSGIPVHQPIVVVKEVDKSSPNLRTALETNDKLTSWELRFWRASATGVEVNFYTLTLTNAYISQIRLEMLNNKYPDLANIAMREKVAFIYGTLKATWTDGDIEYEIPWSSPG